MSPTQDERLEAAIKVFDVELSMVEERQSRKPQGAQSERDKAPHEHHGDWVATARAHLDDAKAGARLRHSRAGWESLLAAQRWRIYGCSVAESDAARFVLAAEAADKLSGWRQAAVTSLLDAPTLRCSEIDALHASLFEATRIRDEEIATNRYGKIALRREQLLVLLGCLAASLLLLAVSLGAIGLDVTETPRGKDAAIWLYVGLFGALGGCLSALRAVSGRSAASRTPDLVEYGWVTVARPLSGSAAALGAFAILQGDVLTLRTTAAGAYLGVAFASGFSERFIVRAVGGVSRSAERG